MLFNVYAVNIESRDRRLLAEGLTEANAEAVVMMAVARRGVDEEFYTIEEIDTEQPI